SVGLGDDRRKLIALDAPLEAHDHVMSLDPGPSALKRDTQHSPDPVAVDRARKRLVADDESCATTITCSGREDDLQIVAVAPAPTAKHRVECAPPRKPVATARAHHRTAGCARQGVRRLRPLARRAASTLRPPTVFILARKPCVRLRLTTEGWNVR